MPDIRLHPSLPGLTPSRIEAPAQPPAPAARPEVAALTTPALPPQQGSLRGQDAAVAMPGLGFRPHERPTELAPGVSAELCEKAAALLGRPLARREASALGQAHLVGIGELGADGERYASLGNYTPAQLMGKTRLLLAAGLREAEVRLLMEKGVAGVTAAESAHFAVTTDLFHGQVVDARPFSANDNRNSLFLVKVWNPKTNRTREALFKPRELGDGGGWNRTPMEYVGYELNRMLGLDYVPPAAYRRGIDVNFTRYAEGVLLHLVPDAHLLGKVDPQQWDVSMDALLSDARIFDVLIQNSDRHSGNFLRGKHWVDGSYRSMLIDQAAGLRPGAAVSLEDDNAFLTGAVKVVRKATLEALERLTFASLKAKLGEFVTDKELHEMLGRRDQMVAYFGKLIAAHGRDQVVLP